MESINISRKWKNKKKEKDIKKKNGCTIKNIHFVEPEVTMMVSVSFFFESTNDADTEVFRNRHTFAAGAGNREKNDSRKKEKVNKKKK